ncbi:hypothetical protein MMC28_005774 [Mycoblastus sanguinarius]|nr:hypothetical protein [Mycoblastus sanguinarius]
MFFDFWWILLASILSRDTTAYAAVPQLTARAASTGVPAPISIPASQDFVGNDGPWSSFTLQIGSPAQDVEVLISTAGFQTWAVVPQGCTSSDPTNCATLRGGEFVPSQSSTWKQNNVTANGTFNLEIEANLGYSGNGEYGYDTVILGWQGSGGPSLDQQIIAGIATPEFWLGIFGLSPLPTNFTNFNHPVPSFISTLKEKSMIPSLSWSYTAGNQYRFNKVLGSLTLGGYDTSRFVPNNVSFAFSQVDERDLVVEIEKITFATSSNTTALSSTSISGVFIDSTIPYLYLPLSVCEAFERAFGITWDSDVQAYLVNDTLHSQLQAQNATVTFSLGNSSAQTVDVSLPYAAFDLTAEYPLATNSTGYFPLVRATNESQYTLGRAFLQEAYLIADYERRNFSVSQCNWASSAPKEDIVAIPSLSESTSSPLSSPGPTPDHSQGLSGGAIAGIVIGCLVGLLIILAIIWRVKTKKGKFLFWGAKPEAAELDALKGSEEQGETDLKTPEMEGGMRKAHEMGGAQSLGQEIDGQMFPGHEIDGQMSPGHELATPIEQRYELGGNENLTHEMPAVEAPASEMAVPNSPARTQN